MSFGFGQKNMDLCAFMYAHICEHKDSKENLFFMPSDEA